MYEIVVSKRKNKKYDVYKNGKYLLSFGDLRYEHFRDNTPIKAYSHLDHNDVKRRDNFRKRFKKHDHWDEDKALFYSWNLLW